MTKPCLVTLLVTLLSLAPAPARGGGPIDPKDLPDPLKAWVPWVLHDRESETCPLVLAEEEERRCAWPTRLELSLDDQGGRFTIDYHVHVKGFQALPGDAEHWPQEVSVGRARAVVVASEEEPSVELAVGSHRVSGRFLWNALPEAIQVPPEVGLLQLTVKGVKVAQPNRDAEGKVYLQKAAAPSEGERLEIVVHRKVRDDNPLELETRIVLQVSGKNREVLLGRTLPPGFVAFSLESPLPARLEPDSRLRLQIRPGTHTILIAARSPGPVRELVRPNPDGPWRKGEEVWVFEAVSALRLVTVEGVSAIDPQQTSLPEGWRKLPAYPIKLGDRMLLSERRRGDQGPSPDRLTLSRALYLDFDGRGLTASDTIGGELRRARRLEMAAPSRLGRVALDGRDQFITRLRDPGRTGIELRPGRLHLSAESRIQSSPSRLPAVGWDQTFHQVSGVLHLPPGWRLLHASGVDEIRGTWVRHWTLLEIFLVLVLSIATARLFGIRWGLLALAGFALLFPESGAPKWIWIAVLAAEALVRAIPEGRVRRAFAGVRLVVLLGLCLAAIPFLIGHLRIGLHPALEQAHRSIRSEEPSDLVVQNATRQVQTVDGNQAAIAGKQTALGTDAEQSLRNLAKDAARSSGMLGILSRQETTAPRKGKLQSLYQTNVEAYDPKAIVQTGPGLPRWQWNRFELRWSGPVEAGQELRLFLLSPVWGLLLALLRATLLAVLVLRMLPWRRGSPISPISPRSTSLVSLLVLGAIAGTPATARAEIPRADLLEELGKRLLAPPACAPSCASSPRMRLEIRDGELRAQIELAAAAETAVPLPGSSSQWLPEEVLLDGKPTRALARGGEAKGTLYLLVPKGVHQVLIRGALPARDSFQLSLPLRPYRVEASVPGWSLEGLHEDGTAEKDLQLTRKAERGAGTLQPGALPPFVAVERTLRLGLTWQVETRVRRLSPLGVAAVLEIPLLPGESVTSPEVRVIAKRAQVNLGPQQAELSWRSLLAERTPILLAAPRALGWREVWQLEASPIWHVESSGIPRVHPELLGGLPEWRPWPGETATISVTRPTGVPGQTVTIDESHYALSPGLRATDAQLALVIRSSRGAQHTLTLPDGAVLESLQVEGRSIPFRQVGRKLTLSLAPGSQRVRLAWREPRGVRPHFRASPIDLGAASVNATVEVRVPDNRWLLFCGGPRLGPSVLFWSLLLGLLAVALALGRVSWAPARTWQWMLLAIGLSQVPIALGATVVLWLLLLGWRARTPTLGQHRFWFNARQIVIAVWTLVALVVLVIAVHEGLLGDPEMQLRGNGSHAQALRWFEDRSGPVPESPWFLSVPITVYRIAMLAWALWLAYSTLRWLRWGWGALGQGGLWLRRPPPPSAPADDAPTRTPTPEPAPEAPATAGEPSA
jgi:hypothetical protein